MIIYSGTVKSTTGKSMTIVVQGKEFTIHNPYNFKIGQVVSVYIQNNMPYVVSRIWIGHIIQKK